MEKKIYLNAGAQKLLGNNSEQHEHDHHHDHSGKLLFLLPLLSLVLLLTALYFDHILKPIWFKETFRIIWYVAAYLPVGLPVVKESLESILKKDFFSEFTLMVIATIGAFAIGEFPEAVTVMLFYAIGEVFQTLAVKRAKLNIKSLLDQRPDEVTILENNIAKVVKAELVEIDSVIQLKPGEKLGLDGVLISDSASFNTAALTGESKPDSKQKGESVLAGMINLNTVTQIRVTAKYADSKLSRILELVQNASAQKAPTELFIRKFARIYTPIVVNLALLIVVLPYLLHLTNVQFLPDSIQHYSFQNWLYRALVFLVISCPCALVISIPLGYFGGIGAASRHGILFKGSNFLDIIADIQHVVMDKTGTLTEGVFQVQEVVFNSLFDKDKILQFVNVIESHSTHPVATAILQYVGERSPDIKIDNIVEISGHGLKGMVDDKELLVGNFKLMDKFNIQYNLDPNSIIYTLIAVAYDGQFVGYITIADSIKADASKTIQALHTMNVKTTMLSGDKHTVVQYVAKALNIDNAFGDLLPEDKVEKVKQIKNSYKSVAFVGDGVNDAPVVALSDVGIAMGGLGSDATIETADVVIQDDMPSKIPMAIKIGKATKKIVWQNIILAFGVKLIVLILGAGGVATMWEAVFADVGVALLAILNAIRIQRMNFDK
ncbi:MAG TPA: heavy metal translocating P-type ATPase [Chitinophagales bacterium]|nr:heavy metal translocating P-type ATPase [Chitinophagales bacterium]HNL17288.1 heavy metal translocating P-type ATPase [Chitinophagales bacterium]